MKIQLLFCLVLAFSLAMVRADDYEENYSEDKIEQSDSAYKDDMSNEQPEKAQSDVEAPKAPAPAKKIVEDAETETTSLVENYADEKQRKLGFCQWGISIWFKPGYQIRCSCMKCACIRGGKWNCVYHFAYCPYYYCGNRIYNPLTQICCCGAVYTKNSTYSCCGYFYYNRRHSKCCNYYSVKSKKVSCPRFRVG